MEAEVDRVESQSIDTAVQPEAHVVERRLADLRVVEVQIRLRAQEIVQVVLPAARLPGPGDAAEYRQPVVRRRAVLARIGPHVPVRLRIGAALAALLEPGVLAGAVAQHLVDDDLEPEAVGLGHQPIEIRQRAKHGVDRPVIGDVVTEIRHRRLEERRHPDRFDAERRNVIQFREYAREIADAVAVGVEKAARIDLVDSRAAPPWIGRRRGGRGQAFGCGIHGGHAGRQLNKSAQYPRH
jgi:hypothetical protein